MIDPDKTDPYGSPPPSDPHEIDAAKLFATAAGEVLREQLRPVNSALADLANLVTRDHVTTSRRLAVLEATRLAPAFAAIVVSLAAFGLAALAVATPAQAAGQRCPDRIESAP